jgi:molecular chaperone DnaK
MDKAHKNPISIDSIIMVGGSSNLRPFQEKIIEIFGKNKIVKPQEDESQWSVAKGAALMQFSNGQFMLNDDVGIQLSDNTLYNLFESNKSHVGSQVGPISFSLIEDAQSANFIFKDGNGNLLSRATIATKGFLQENLNVNAIIDDDQIADIVITNNFIHDNYKVNALIDKLNFYYDLSALKELRND